jgi:dUTP pyrophosphatase
MKNVNGKVQLSYFKISKEALDPVFATPGSACFDIFTCFHSREYQGYNHNNKSIIRNFADSSAGLIIMPGDRMMVPTGLIFDIPENYSLRIHIRSGTSFKKGLFLLNSEGIIDSDYIEELSILVGNNSDNVITINNGERIAQGELVKNITYSFIETEKKPMQKTSRKGGMGSTGSYKIE